MLVRFLLWRIIICCSCKWMSTRILLWVIIITCSWKWGSGGGFCCMRGSFSRCGTDKKYIKFAMFHSMYSLLWNKGPWIRRPVNVSSRRFFYMFIHLACLVCQFSSCRPRMLILCSFSKLLGGAGTSWNIPNCNWTLSDWCHSTIVKKKQWECMLSKFQHHCTLLAGLMPQSSYTDSI